MVLQIIVQRHRNLVNIAGAMLNKLKTCPVWDGGARGMPAQRGIKGRKQPHDALENQSLIRGISGKRPGCVRDSRNPPCATTQPSSNLRPEVGLQ
ncbi:hypothetical protein HBH56_084690 [Parastagonospora nodorum]|uniref:Uncharacterized protein n=1 Tax=Phaeosphaeria nodorum (strain SN15 / ATCC MYA-4574 / FGSC 10173) TaxID=321614 RepID=A0A7U2F140_PHANO|nr:hypothetical protein HBH56_084690 [Parastagonospora nodorum]QRC96834.1 hypothetical protein JI435_409670 [Parastagonospora nodorum SN15]KAH3930083.1 hypothetical protein HBH54_117150 [Parastagonospora nodorum]KAH4069296.1 hypothetical protein HBH50_111360 [Parastagonospora nodorum]KAH4088366.1 hypothetical protein HBH48_128330 [Parastagonospora nodorum]